jgi:hypothetical protein
MTDTTLTSMYLYKNGMLHSEITKFHPNDRQCPPVQEHQFELLKVPEDHRLIIKKITHNYQLIIPAVPLHPLAVK